MLLKKDTIAIQKKLAKYCRDGKLVEIEGASADRLPHYRRLVYNVMYGILEQSYPISKSLLSEPEFKSLVDSYIILHDAQEPQVWKVPGEFYQYCVENPPLLLEEYPFLLELHELEWMEILVYNQEDKIIPEYNAIIPQESNVVVVNPEFEIRSFEFPVFKGQWDEINGKKGKYNLLIFRHNETNKVHFLEISTLHIELIELMQNGMILEEVFSKLNSKFNLEQVHDLNQLLLSFIEKLYLQGFVLGVK